ncbi:sensor histidine kinase [Oceaniglobus trochenteri]|uniref:sensor histidine kinase n=1 Tax=Oceaniglobus trochenteri TaxID=2763260 RepID=UPI001D000160|nr:histidine kinase dimerization/phosphoacceptor domain -containing protein [Oceaniglobus trochenteri]
MGFKPLNRLGVRLVLLLGLALLPVGIMAMLQSYRVIRDANERVETSLLGETLSAAQSERRIVTRSAGVAQSLALLIPTLIRDPEACSAHMRELVSGRENIAFAGFVNADGILACASDGVGADMNGEGEVTAYLENPKPTISSTSAGKVTGIPALILTEPVFLDGEPMGFVSLSIPHTALTIEPTSQQTMTPSDVLTFDQNGVPLTSGMGLDEVERRLPANRALAALTSDRGLVFQDVDRSGKAQIFTVVPLVHGQVYTLAIWPHNTAIIGLPQIVPALLLPVLMWLASLAVAFVAVNRLVIRHIRSLRRNIRAFSATRRIRKMPDADLPAEIREVTDAFALMTEQILRDEADQENLLHEKDVLLKEVHHRVKNNLQLIASITNMQIRRSRHNETKFMLRRLQDRVMSLATVHRSLYQASILSEVRADLLVADLSRQLARSAALPGQHVDFSMETEPVLLYPDQAVPLSLLVTEAMTNAFKYLGRPKEGAPWVFLSLRPVESGEIELCVRNSTGTPVIDPTQDEVSGLGSQLIAAFVMQLGGVAEVDESDPDAYQVRVTFNLADFTLESGENEVQ